MMFSCKALSFDRIPTSSNIEMPVIKSKAGKKSQRSFCGFDGLHEDLFSNDRDVFYDMIQHDSAGAIISSEIED